MDYSLPRGTQDILPDEVDYWNFVEKTAKKIFDLYNFNEIRTPIFESSQLFNRVCCRLWIKMPLCFCTEVHNRWADVPQNWS